MVICLERRADLRIAQLMPLPLTVSCFSKIQIGFTFLVPAHPGSPGKRAIKRVCVCVCVQLTMVSIRSGLSRASLTSLIRPWLCCGSSFKTSTCSVIPTSSVKPRFHSPVSDQVARPITDATEFVMR